jgi:hypothetical protein
MVERSSRREFQLPVVRPLVSGETRLAPLGREHGFCQALLRRGTVFLVKTKCWRAPTRGPVVIGWPERRQDPWPL